MTDDHLPLSILVVDAHEDGADSLAELLGLFGYRVAVARTGSGALRASAFDPPDVVLLDVRLPDLDGWEVAARMREEAGARQPVVVALSTFISGVDLSRSADAGVDLHWLKPARPAALLATLARFARLLNRGGDPVSDPAGDQYAA